MNLTTNFNGFFLFKQVLIAEERAQMIHMGETGDSEKDWDPCNQKLRGEMNGKKAISEKVVAMNIPKQIKDLKPQIREAP